MNRQSNVSFPLIQNDATKNKKKDKIKIATLDHLKAAVMPCSRLEHVVCCTSLHFLKKVGTEKGRSSNDVRLILVDPSK